MNRFPDFVRLDSFYIGIRGNFQTHFVLEKAGTCNPKLYDRRACNSAWHQAYHSIPAA